MISGVKHLGLPAISGLGIGYVGTIQRGLDLLPWIHTNNVLKMQEDICTRLFMQVRKTARQMLKHELKEPSLRHESSG